MLELKAIEYNPQKHIPQLDGIRGLAILLVFLNHLFTFVPLAIIGWVGVDLFFVLSGFLITGILIDSRRKKNYYGTFLKRRAFRIFPLYYFFLILFFIIYPLLKTDKILYYDYIFKNQLFFWTYTSNIFFALKGWPVNQILDHFWSLSIEEQFYLFWPFIILKYSDKNIINVSILLILISIIIRNLIPIVPFSTTFTFGRLDGLCIGAITAVLIRNNRAFLEKISIYILFLTGFSLFTIGIITHNLLTSNPYFIRIGFTLFDLFFASLIIVSLDASFLKGIFFNVFSSGFFRFFGRYSYGLYVFHWPIYQFTSQTLHNAFIKTFKSVLVVNMLSTFSILGIVIVVALLSFHFIEKPFLASKNKVAE